MFNIYSLAVHKATTYVNENKSQAPCFIQFDTVLYKFCLDWIKYLNIKTTKKRSIFYDLFILLSKKKYVTVSLGVVEITSVDFTFWLLFYEVLNVPNCRFQVSCTTYRK